MTVISVFAVCKSTSRRSLATTVALWLLRTARSSSVQASGVHSSANRQPDRRPHHADDREGLATK